MPDTDGNKKSDETARQDTPLHAYKDGRPEDVEGDPTGKDIQEKPVKSRQDPDKH